MVRFSLENFSFFFLFREIFIIYKKIIIVFLCFSEKNKELQLILMLFLLGFYYYITKIKQPFQVYSQNKLENWANFSSFFLIFAANFLFSSRQQVMREIVVLLVILFTGYFFLTWAKGTFDIFFMNNIKLFKLKFFCFYAFYMSFKKSYKTVVYKGNLKKYFKEIVGKYNLENNKLSIEKKEISIVKSSNFSVGKFFKKILGAFGVV